MNDERKALDQLVELLVYAPIGLLYERDDVLPRLVTRGRSQVQLARVLGQLAVRRGQGQLEERLSDVLGPSGAGLAKLVTDFGALVGLAPPPGADPPSAGDAAPPGSGRRGVEGAEGHRGARETDAASAPAAGGAGTAGEEPPGRLDEVADDEVTDERVEPVPAAGAGTAGEQPPAATHPGGEAVRPSLPIAGYDQLRARDIIPRLAGLSPAQRRVVRDHEAAHRHRKTVLHQIELLGT